MAKVDALDRLAVVLVAEVGQVEKGLVTAGDRRVLSSRPSMPIMMV